MKEPLIKVFRLYLRDKYIGVTIMNVHMAISKGYIKHSYGYLKKNVDYSEGYVNHSSNEIHLK